MDDKMKKAFLPSEWLVCFAAIIVGVILLVIYSVLRAWNAYFVDLFVALMCTTVACLICFGGRKVLELKLEQKMRAGMELFRMIDYNERRYNKEP
ncbi:hypothetical protein IK110_04155 [Candidatus Saccharibacteria bacterium]|nr:hypothetical protein [Candidatus Saccharibacteria bacterium]